MNAVLFVLLLPELATTFLLLGFLANVFIQRRTRAMSSLRHASRRKLAVMDNKGRFESSADNDGRAELPAGMGLPGSNPSKSHWP